MQIRPSELEVEKLAFLGKTTSCPETGGSIKSQLAHWHSEWIPLVFPKFSSISDTGGFQTHTSSKCLCKISF